MHSWREKKWEEYFLDQEARPLEIKEGSSQLLLPGRAILLPREGDFLLGFRLLEEKETRCRVHILVGGQPIAVLNLEGQALQFALNDEYPLPLVGLVWQDVHLLQSSQEPLCILPFFATFTHSEIKSVLMNAMESWWVPPTYAKADTAYLFTLGMGWKVNVPPGFEIPAGDHEMPRSKCILTRPGAEYGPRLC